MPLSGVCGEIKQKLFKQLFVTKFHRILGLFYSVSPKLSRNIFFK